MPTYAQGARVSTPYGTAAGGSAYNPHTGTAAATRQASSPYGQWGGSVVAGQNQAVATQHATTSRGTVARAQSTTGGQAAAASTARGNVYAGNTASGDMYAGKDGRVYKNTGAGWQTYQDGSWNSVNKPTPTSAQQQAQSSTAATSAQQRAQSYSQSGGTQSLDREMQSRQRGEFQSQRYQGAQRSSGGGRRGG
ncbi:MAG: hypothetical protein EHM61_28430, partial [Acidobacteria bacterium]